MWSFQSIILFLLLSVNSSNQATVTSTTDSSKQNNTSTNKSVIESEKSDRQTTQFPPINPTIDEDAKLTVPELITKYGYNVEVHHVTTEDGYIIALHRIAGGPTSPPRKGKRAVYWTHGVGDSSAGSIVGGPGHSLVYLLVDNDFDVWIANARGTADSTNHITLNPFGSLEERERFWSFSFHEIGVYDAAASIDYILAQTGQPKLQFVGHSQGGAVMLILASERPEYNDKIEMMHALAPTVFLSNIRGPWARAIAAFLPTLVSLTEIFGIHFIYMTHDIRVQIAELLCSDKMPTQSLCEIGLQLVMGYESDQMNNTMLPVIFGHTPAGCSFKQLIHFLQLINSGHFRKYDFGPEINRLKYNRTTPPDYNLKKVTAPVAVYYSRNDWMATVPDVRILMKKLPNLVKRYLVPHKEFNHIDFILGTQAPTLLFNEVLKTMKASHTKYQEELKTNSTSKSSHNQ